MLFLCAVTIPINRISQSTCRIINIFKNKKTESKILSSVQVVREPGGLVEGFQNLYIVVEGNGYAGGIVSSASDGVKAAIGLVLK